MYPDDEACKKANTLYILWTRNLRQCSADRIAAKLAAQHRQEIPTKAIHCRDGAYNRCYRIIFQKGPDAIVRFPIMGRVALRKEKINDEVAVMAYIAQATSIPIPAVRGNGVSGSGPYIVIDFVSGNLLSDHLQAPLRDNREPAILDPGISEHKLRAAYRQMAYIILKLHRCQFSHIGSLVSDDRGGWSIGTRPFTHNINELLTYANFPPSAMPQGTFSTATEYFLSLSEIHMQHLKTQRNNAVYNEADCRRKYVARCLFRRIARNFSTSYNNGPFSLFCDDLRPSNVIVDTNLDIKAVIDWEFCYAAPAEFTHCSPWWLLLANPDDWPGGLNDFATQYIPRHNIFLDVLRECERELAYDITIDHTLSERMQQSMDNGDFWVCLAARSSFAFDDIYWNFIDQRYYGEFTSLEDRVELLEKSERAELDGFFKQETEQAAERKLDPYWTVDEIIAS